MSGRVGRSPLTEGFLAGWKKRRKEGKEIWEGGGLYIVFGGGLCAFCHLVPPTLLGLRRYKVNACHASFYLSALVNMVDIFHPKFWTW